MVALPHVAAPRGAAGFYALLQIGIVRFLNPTQDKRTNQTAQCDSRVDDTFRYDMA